MKLVFWAATMLLILGLFVPVAGMIALYLLTMELWLVLFELARVSL